MLLVETAMTSPKILPSSMEAVCRLPQKRSNQELMIPYQCLSRCWQGQERLLVSTLALHIMRRETRAGGPHRCPICAHVLAPHRRHNARPGNDRREEVPERCLHPAIARRPGSKRARSGFSWRSHEV